MFAACPVRRFRGATVLPTATSSGERASLRHGCRLRSLQCRAFVLLIFVVMSRVCVVVQNPDPVRRASLVGYVVATQHRCVLPGHALVPATSCGRRVLHVHESFLGHAYGPLDVVDVSRGRMRMCTGGVQFFSCASWNAWGAGTLDRPSRPRTPKD